MKEEWRLTWTNKWRRPKKVDIPNISRNNAKTLNKVAGLESDLRRKQFLQFFTEFFDKFDEKTAGKNTYGFTFSDEEKEQLLKKYFKKYYNEKAELPTEI